MAADASACVPSSVGVTAMFWKAGPCWLFGPLPSGAHALRMATIRRPRVPPPRPARGR